MIGWMPGRRRPATAAEWFAARRAGTPARLEKQFQEWLAERPAHGEEYALCEITWEVATDAARQVPLPTRLTTEQRAPVGRRVAAFAVALAAAACALWLWPASAQTWATAPGEQRTLVLEDGSRVTLNTRTSIEVRLGRRARDITLVDGEAFFEVARDSSRPFTVRTSLGFARAVGTRFNVYLERRHLAVTTEEGTVLVNGAAPGGSGVLVAAGRQADLRDGMTTAAVGPADLSTVLNWRMQRLEVNNAPLGTVLEDFSRYTAMPVRADTPAIAALRVSAVLRTGDVQALEATLTGAFGLKVERRGSELVVSAANTADAR